MTEGIRGASTTDVFIKSLHFIRKKGQTVRDTREVIGLHLLIEEPRERILFIPEREFDLPASVFSALSALAGIGSPYGIVIHDPWITDARELYCGYGRRLRGKGSIDQIEAIKERISLDMYTRRAVIPVFLPEDNDRSSTTYSSPPCPVSFQFFVRGGRLHMVTYMRSQAVTAILPYDLFILTFFQEGLATELGLELGYYHHFIGSAHYYEQEEEKIGTFLSTDNSNSGQWTMSRMPKEISPFRAAESIIEHITACQSSQGEVSIDALYMDLPGYWQEMAWLAFLSTGAGMRQSEEVLDRLPSSYRGLLSSII